MKTAIAIAAALLLLASPLTSYCATNYQAIDLGAPSGFGNTWALGINDNGEVVGYAAPLVVGQPQHAWYWSASTGMVDLGPGTAEAINNRGHIAGCYYATGDHACIWTSLTTRVDRGAGCCIAINEADETAGAVLTQEGTHAAYWSANGALTDFGDLVGPLESYGEAINESGQVTGRGGDTAFLWDSRTGKARFFYPLGGSFSYSADLNDYGQVVGAAETSTHYQNIVVWNPDGTKRIVSSDLVFQSKGAGINNLGQVAAGTHIYNPDGTSIYLSGYAGDQLSDINESGWVVGSYWSSTGHRSAILWKPVPEPGSAAVLLCGLLSSLGLARRKRAKF
jgi:probable HAF family extracellular repeat protein